MADESPQKIVDLIQLFLNAEIDDFSELAKLLKLDIGEDFVGIDLSGEDLSFNNLKGANFKEANLSHANLSYANLNDAILENADLSGTNLTRANLVGANLTGAILKKSNFIEATWDSLRGVNLSAANISGLNLKGAILSDADLSNTILRDVNLENADLSRANLSGSDLTNARLRGANLTEAILKGSTLEGASLKEALSNVAYETEYPKASFFESLLKIKDFSITFFKSILGHVVTENQRDRLLEFTTNIALVSVGLISLISLIIYPITSAAIYLGKIILTIVIYPIIIFAKFIPNKINSVIKDQRNRLLKFTADIALVILQQGFLTASLTTLAAIYLSRIILSVVIYPINFLLVAAIIITSYYIISLSLLAACLKGASCLSGNTIVSTPDGEKLIKNIRSGDILWSWDFSERKRVQRNVLKCLEYNRCQLVDITIEGLLIPLSTTASHSFWTQRGWVRCEKLTSNDSLFLINQHGQSAFKNIIDIQATEKYEPVYNLRSEGEHNFTANQVLVHNFSFFRSIRTTISRMRFCEKRNLK